jgi:hypothetical protein
MREKHRIACWALLLAVVSGPVMASPARAATFVYVGNAESNEIYVLELYAIDPASGKLTKLKEYPVGQNPNWVEIVDLP